MSGEMFMRMNEFRDDVNAALVHIKNSIIGLESNFNNINAQNFDTETKNKAINKINTKLDIFETLEILCEEYLK